jgi:hypothetical protein
MLPVYFSEGALVEGVFGQGSQLSNACLECFYTGAKKIIAFRINSTYATATFNDASDNPLIKIYSINAGDTGTAIKVEVATVNSRKVLTIYESDGSIKRTYALEGTSISGICTAINYDASVGSVGVVAESINESAMANTLADTVVGGVTLAGGTNESSVSGATLYERLGAIYSMLETLTFDILIPMPVRYTDHAIVTTEYSHIPKDKYFYNQLGDFCNIKANGGNPITAIIASDDCNPDVDVSTMTIPSEIRRTQYIVVTKSWLATPFYNGNGTRYICDGTATLGGLLNSINVSINPVNKPAGTLIGIYNDGETRYEFSANQVKALANLGICTFHSSIRKGVCLASAVTSTLPTHPCASIKNARLVAYIIRVMSVMLDSYIGEGSVNQHGSINKLIEAQLKSMQTDSIVSDYSYTVTSDQLGSNISIDIEVVPCNDIQTVSATVMVNL